MDTTHAMDPSGAPLGSPLGGQGTGSRLPDDAPHSPSGVGVVDKASRILDALEAGPASLADLVAALTAPMQGAARETKALLLAAHERDLDEQRRAEREAQVRRFRELAQALGTS